MVVTMSPKENLLRVIRHDNPQWVPNGMEAVITISPPVVERPAQAGFDAFMVHWSLNPEAEGGTYPTHGGNTIKDICRWQDQITIPDVSALDWTSVAEQAKNVDRDQHLLQGFVEMGLFERSYLLLGMSEALICYMEHPKEMYDLLGAIADYKIALISKFHEVAKLDILWYGDDWGTQNSLFIPPDVWRNIIKPHTKRIYDCAKERGIIVNQHSCGKIESIFADIVEMGADIWNPCQPCNDLAGLKRRYGQRITFCGGIDSQFVLDKPGVTIEEVRAEVRKRIDEMATNGGYIASPSHGVPYDQAIIDAMNDEIAKYGRAIYRNDNQTEV